MQLNQRLKKLEQVQQTGLCECKQDFAIEVYDDSQMTAREILEMWNAEVQPCPYCGRQRKHFVIRFSMCQCEENLDFRAEIPRDWQKRDDQEYWRHLQTRKCEKCGESIHYGPLLPENRTQ